MIQLTRSPMSPSYGLILKNGGEIGRWWRNAEGTISIVAAQVMPADLRELAGLVGNLEKKMEHKNVRR